MKISYLSEAAIPSRTANSIQVMKMCQALAQQGHQVTLFAPARQEERLRGISSLWHHYGVEPLFNIKWIWAPGREPLDKYLYAASAGVRCRWPDGAELVYARHLSGAIMAAALGSRLVFEAHDVPSSHGRLGTTLFDLLLRQACLERLVVISRALREFLLAAWPQVLDPVDVVVAPDGVDLERFRCLPSPADARAQLGVSTPERFVAGYAGHLYPGRGVELIIELAQHTSQIDFLVVGGNPEDVRRLEDRVSRAGADNVTFTGFVANTEIPIHLAACDVLLMPMQRRVTVAGGRGDTSRWMSPLKMFEYMAAGRPILASDLPVLREVLNDDNALLLDPADVDAWRTALLRAMADPALREQLVAQAQRDVARFSWRERAATCLSGIDA